MGYTSDVYLRVAEPLVEVIDAARKLNKTLDKMLTYGSGEQGVNWSSSKTDFHWANTKWYDTYPEVMAVNDMLDMLQDDDYGFVALGEGEGDIERKGDPAAYDIYIQTSVDW